MNIRPASHKSVTGLALTSTGKLGNFKIINFFSKFDTWGDFQVDFQDDLGQKNSKKGMFFLYF